MPAVDSEAHFADRLVRAVRRTGTPTLVGLDPRYDRLPSGLQRHDASDPQAKAQAFVEFCRGIIDVVADLVPAVKPQAAFFEQLGPCGMAALAEVIAYARSKNLLVILDGKRNDIGSTAERLCRRLLGRQEPKCLGRRRADGQPLPGRRQPHAVCRRRHERGEGVFVLVKTSNPGGKTFQDLVADGKPVYRHVADYGRAALAGGIGRSLRLWRGRGRRRGDVSRASRRAARRDAAHLVSRARLRQPGGHGPRRGRRIRCKRPRRDRQQLAGHHLRACAARVCRAIRRRPLAGRRRRPRRAT